MDQFMVHACTIKKILNSKSQTFFLSLHFSRQFETRLWLLRIILTSIVYSCSCQSYGGYSPTGSFIAETYLRPSYKRPPTTNSRYKQLISIYEGKNLEFSFPSEAIRKQALSSGEYDPDSPIPIDVDVYYKGECK